MMNVKENIKQLFLYAIVGGIATVAEWLMFYILNEKFSLYYITATTIAFAFSTFVNWIVGRWMLFKQKQSLLKELTQIYLTGIAGLLLNILIMWIAIEYVKIPDFIAKVMATCLVFVWNFVIRKVFIYRIK